MVTPNIGSSGSFSTNFVTSTIAASTTPYSIIYGYPGDANFAGASDSSTSLIVNAPATLISISVTPANSVIGLGGPVQFVATGHNSDSTTTDLTGTAVWSSLPPGPGTIAPSGGLFTAATTGSGGLTTISAAAGSIIGSTTLAVTVPGGFTLVGNTNVARDPHTATQLNHGRVLIAGGYIDTFGDGTNSSEIYDPGTGMFSFTKDPSGLTTGLLQARDNHTATLLPDGTVLFTGGSSATKLGNKLVCPADCFGKSTVELYQPSSAISGSTLVSISVPPAGFNSLRVVPVRFIATGTFSDGTTKEVLTSSVTWIVSDPNVVSMSADGEAWVGIPATSPETITITAAVPGSAAPPAQTTITIE